MPPQRTKDVKGQATRGHQIVRAVAVVAALGQPHEFVVHGLDLPAGASWPELRMTTAATWAGGEVHPSGGNGRADPLKFFSASLYAPAETVLLRVGVALDPW